MPTTTCATRPTAPNASVGEIIEAFADRATIEQDFHDVKEVWGSGQQQVRNIWNNLAVYNLNLWIHTLTELWAWDRSGRQISRPQRLTLGRRRASAFARQSSQSPTGADHEQPFIGDHRHLVSPQKNHSTNQKPHDIGRLA